MKTMSSYQKLQEIQKLHRNPQLKIHQKLPKKIPEIEATKTANTRGDKYNLRPDPNPNYSDSYRYQKQIKRLKDFN